VATGGVVVKKFEYDVITYSGEMFRQLVFFCSENGECGISEIPSRDTTMLQDALNKRGEQGWELIQLSFGKDGVVSFWKRSIA